MQLIEKTTLRTSDIPRLKELAEKKLHLNKISFVNLVLTQEHDAVTVYTSSIILELEQHELVITNHYHESEHFTGLQYLLFRKREKSNRPYPMQYINRHFQSTIDKVEIWGINETYSHWENDEITYYQSLGKLSKDVQSVEHILQFQHIIRLVLSNGNSIIIKSDLPKHIFMGLYTDSNSSDAYLSGFYKWEVFSM